MISDKIEKDIDMQKLGFIFTDANDYEKCPVYAYHKSYFELEAKNQ